MRSKDRLIVMLLDMLIMNYRWVSRSGVGYEIAFAEDKLIPRNYNVEARPVKGTIATL